MTVEAASVGATMTSGQTAAESLRAAAATASTTSLGQAVATSGHIIAAASAMGTTSTGQSVAESVRAAAAVGATTTVGEAVATTEILVQAAAAGVTTTTAEGVGETLRDAASASNTTTVGQGSAEAVRDAAASGSTTSTGEAVAKDVVNVAAAGATTSTGDAAAETTRNIASSSSTTSSAEAVAGFAFGADPGAATSLDTRIAALAGSEVYSIWNAVDDSQFRTSGTGTEVATLIDQVGSGDATNATASQRPDMDAGGAADGRDRISFDRANSQRLVTGSVYPSSLGDRFYAVMVMEIASTGVTQIFGSFSDKVTAVGNRWLFLQENGGNVLHRLVADDGASGDDDDIFTHSAAGSGENLRAVWFTNPHRSEEDDSIQTSSETAGVSNRAEDQPNAYWTFAAGPNGYFSPASMHLRFGMVGKLSSAVAVPNWWAEVKALIQAYHGL